MIFPEKLTVVSGPTEAYPNHEQLVDYHPKREEALTWQYHPLLGLFASGGVVSLGVAGYCWQYIQTRSWSYLVGSIGLLGFSDAVWVLAATLRTASTGEPRFCSTRSNFWAFCPLQRLPSSS